MAVDPPNSAQSPTVADELLQRWFGWRALVFPGTLQMPTTHNGAPAWTGLSRKNYRKGKRGAMGPWR